MRASFKAAVDEDLPAIAERLLQQHPPAPSVRNAIQDVLWSDLPGPEIPKRFRRELGTAIGHDTHLEADGFDDLLARLWDLDSGDPLAGVGWDLDNSLRARIDRHVHQNDRWSAEHIFNAIGALNASDRRFALFIEGLASGEVRPNEASQRRFVEVVNGILRSCGVELRETGSEGGYPVFSVAAIHSGAPGRPKNLIFASATKPDLRFRDAVNNDIEIVTNAEKVLVYDRTIGIDGLTWRDLQVWWSKLTTASSGEVAKRTLYRRLRESLPGNSPPQTLLFDAFHRHYADRVPDLPALLPEVWLHWDPKTVRERGADALLRFRMDFLLLLPGGIRVVIEVDGKQHFANDDGRAQPTKYAAMVAADRDLKLGGYEVYRFGAAELEGDTGRHCVQTFFDALFRRYCVIPRA